MIKLAQLHLSTELLEEILTARNNDYVTTTCPQDVKIIKVSQDSDDQANHRVVLLLESEDESFPDVSEEERRSALISGNLVGIPLLTPFEYTVVDPESPPTTEETSDG